MPFYPSACARPHHHACHVQAARAHAEGDVVLAIPLRMGLSIATIGTGRPINVWGGRMHVVEWVGWGGAGEGQGGVCVQRVGAYNAAQANKSGTRVCAAGALHRQPGAHAGPVLPACLSCPAGRPAGVPARLGGCAGGLAPGFASNGPIVARCPPPTHPALPLVQLSTRAPSRGRGAPCPTPTGTCCWTRWHWPLR